MIPPAWTRGLLAWLATYGLHSTLFLGATWLACRIRAPRSVRARERAWRLALLGGLLTASLQSALGARPWLGRIEWNTPAAPATTAETVASLPESTPQPAPVEPPAREVLRHERPEPTRAPIIAHAPESRESVERIEPHVAPLGVHPTTTPIPVHRAPVEGVPGERVPGERAPLTSLESVDDPTSISTTDVAPAATIDVVPPPALVEPAPEIETASPEAPASSAGTRLAAWPGVVLLAWTALGLVGLLGIAAAWTQLWRSLLGRVPLVDGPLVAHLEELCRRARVRRRIRLSTSTRLTSPVSMGILRPEICLPVAVLSRLSPAQQQALLAHELGHAVRRDPLWFGVYALVERVLFFQPLNRLARRQLQELAEIASDDWAVRWTGARIALASCLTEVAGWILGERPRAAVVPGLGGHRSRLGRRVERLLDDRRSPTAEPRAPWWPPVAGAALAAVTLAVPGVSATVRALGAPIEKPGDEVRDDASALAGTEALLIPPPSMESDASAEQPSPVATLDDAGVSAPAGDDVQSERALLDGELSALESEIAELRAELESRRLEERFAASMDAIEARLRGLRARQELARALLEHFSTNTPP